MSQFPPTLADDQDVDEDPADKPYAERMAAYKDGLDPTYHEVFDKFVGKGKKPGVVVATIKYLTTATTQQIAADRHGVTVVSIRNNVEAVAEALESAGHTVTVDV